MKLLTARYVDGRLDLPEGSLQDGDLVTVLVRESGEDFDLTAEQKEKLRAAMAEADRGEGIDGWRLLEELRG